MEKSELNKWRFLYAAPHLDARNRHIVGLAKILWEAAQRRPERFVNLAHCVARDNIAFVRDTSRVGGEDIAGYTRLPSRDDAVEALLRGADDCDAKSRIFVALCLAAKIPAKMMPLERGDMLQHVYGAVCLGEEWLPVETTLRRARVGDDPYEVPKELSGEWLR